MFKVGIMGCGIVATFRHIPAILENPELELSAIFDPNPQKLQKIQDRFQFPADKCFTNMDEFMKQKMDIVSITSPATYHKENCLAAARHGKHVICEKPLALTEEEAQEMIDAMKKAGKNLFVGLVCRFAPVARKIHEVIQDGTIGAVRSLRLIFNWNCHGKYRNDDDTGEYGINHRREGRMFEGGPMVDCGTHQIDLARWWLGSEVISFSGFGAWVDDYEAPDHTWLHMDHANGAHTMIEISFSYCHTVSEPRSEFIYELIGTDGVIRYDRNQQKLIVHGAEQRLEIPQDNDLGFNGMYAELVNALKTGKSDMLATAEDGLIATRISHESTEEAIKNREKIQRKARATAAL